MDPSVNHGVLEHIPFKYPGSQLDDLARRHVGTAWVPPVVCTSPVVSGPTFRPFHVPYRPPQVEFTDKLLTNTIACLSSACNLRSPSTQCQTLGLVVSGSSLLVLWVRGMVRIRSFHFRETLPSTWAEHLSSPYRTDSASILPSFPLPFCRRNLRWGFPSSRPTLLGFRCITGFHVTPVDSATSNSFSEAQSFWSWILRRFLSVILRSRGVVTNFSINRREYEIVQGIARDSMVKSE